LHLLYGLREHFGPEEAREVCQNAGKRAGERVLGGREGVRPEERPHVLESPHFFLLEALEVMRPYVVPELSEQPLVGVVGGDGLRVGYLEVGAELGEGRKGGSRGDRRGRRTFWSRP
jgi:hypothetical protein